MVYVRIIYGLYMVNMSVLSVLFGLLFWSPSAHVMGDDKGLWYFAGTVLFRFSAFVLDSSQAYHSEDGMCMVLQRNTFCNQNLCRMVSLNM